LTSSCLLVLGLWPDSCSKSKVGEADIKFIIFDQDVFGFDVSVHNLTLMDSHERVDELRENFPGVSFIEVSTRLDFHVIPQICKCIEWQNDCDVFIFIYNDVLDLANSCHTNQFIHDLYLIFDILEKIFLSDFINAHVLQAVKLILDVVLAEASHSDHTRS
jgi:hypothetical protein